MAKIFAEWEKQELVMLTFPHSKSDWNYCLKEITKTYIQMIKAITKYEKCLILCDDIARVKNILKPFLNNNTLFVQISTNDTWIRDYGAIDCIDRNKIISYDFTFNGWGKKFDAHLDNKANQEIYKQNIFQNSLKKIDFVLEGGSIDTNSKGVLLTTERCLLEKNRNPHLCKKEIDTYLKQLFDLEKIIWLKHGYLRGDDTDSHIDMIARFLDSNTIAYIKCENEDDEHFEELRKMEDELQKTGFKLAPLPLPSPVIFNGKRVPATYLNFLLINDAILVPQYNDKNDEKILTFFNNFYKNRDIIPIDSTILVREHGSIHCATINRWVKPKEQF